MMMISYCNAIDGCVEGEDGYYEEEEEEEKQLPLRGESKRVCSSPLSQSAIIKGSDLCVALC